MSEYLQLSIQRMATLLKNGALAIEARERIASFICTMRIFLAEVSCYMKDWKQAMDVIEVWARYHCGLLLTSSLSGRRWQ